MVLSWKFAESEARFLLGQITHSSFLAQKHLNLHTLVSFCVTKHVMESPNPLRICLKKKANAITTRLECHKFVLNPVISINVQTRLASKTNSPQPSDGLIT